MTDNPQPAWPRRWPICRFAGLGLSLLGGLILVHSWMRHAPALERFYLSDYALLTTLPDIPVCRKEEQAPAIGTNFPLSSWGHSRPQSNLQSRCPVRSLSASCGLLRRHLRRGSAFTYTPANRLCKFCDGRSPASRWPWSCLSAQASIWTGNTIRLPETVVFSRALPDQPLAL